MTHRGGHRRRGRLVTKSRLPQGGYRAALPASTSRRASSRRPCSAGPIRADRIAPTARRTCSGRGRRSDGWPRRRATPTCPSHVGIEAPGSIEIPISARLAHRTRTCTALSAQETSRSQRNMIKRAALPGCASCVFTLDVPEAPTANERAQRLGPAEHIPPLKNHLGRPSSSVQHPAWMMEWIEDGTPYFNKGAKYAGPMPRAEK